MGGSMTDKPEAEHTSDDPQKPLVRKRWHAPGFVVMDVVSTDTMCQGGTDGAQALS